MDIFGTSPPKPPGPLPGHVVLYITVLMMSCVTQVKELWRNLAAKTVGVARVDLRRPT